jgi:hypothetical protein
VKLPGGGNPQRVSIHDGQKKKSGVVQAGAGSPVFLPAVLYDSGGSNVLQSNGGVFQGIAVADVNGDGKLDVVVSNLAGPNLSGDGVLGVLLGNGDGTFQSALTFGSGGYGANSVAVADVNGDGKPDVLVANICASGSDCTTGTVAVLLGNGDGTFQPAVTYASGGQTALSIAVADVNGDGKPDLLVANQSGDPNGSGLVGVLLGNGNGTFQPAVSYSSGGENTSSLAVADLNGDGKPDAVVTIAGSPSVNVLLNNGDGTFQAAVVYGTGGFIPTAVAIADVDKDGKADLVVANWYSGTLAVLLGNGDGTFQAAVTYLSGGASPDSVVVVDVNGDGIPDLVAANCGSSQDGYGCSRTDGVVSVLLGNGDGTFQPAVAISSGAFNDISVAVADVNGDGKPDLLVGNQGGGNNGDGSVGVLLNNTNVYPTTTTLASSPNPSVFGQSVTFTAAVASASGTPTGTVAFFDGSTALGSALVVNGSASFSFSSLAFGAHSITAAFHGSGGFGYSTSAPLRQVVNPASTTTSLVSSANPARVKQRVTYTATVTGQYGGAATGTVTFADGGATITTVALSANQAAYSTSYPAMGTHSITATYSGDANNGGSMSSALTQEIGNVHFLSETTLATSGSPSSLGQPVTFTATVTSTHGTIPNGELVTFYDGSTEIGTGTTAGAVANFTTSSLTAKTHTIKATYSGDGTFKASSGAVTQVVDKYATTTALVSSLNPSAYGQAVTWTATVTSTGPNTPTGSVKFGGLGYAQLSGGVATLTKSWLDAGTYAITAEYEGDSASAPSTSSVLDQVVNPASTTTAITSSANPSSSGQSVTFTATVTSSTGAHATGTITFTAGTTTLGTVPANIASISTATLPVGSTTITATYNGATDFTGSSGSLTQTVGAASSAAVTQTIEAGRANPPTQLPPCPSTTKVFSSGASDVTEPVTFTSVSNMNTYCHNVYNVICSGDVFFYDWVDGRRNLLGTGASVKGNGCARTFETTSLMVGTHLIEAIYTNDPIFGPSSGRVTQEVSTWPTTTTLTSSPNPSTYGQEVTFTATPAGGIENVPTGKVRISDGTIPFGTATLNGNGVVTFTRKNLAVGTNSITAEYLGDSLSAKSTSPVLNQVVNPASTTTAIISSANPSSPGQTVTFTAGVTSSTGAHATPAR